MKCELCDEYDGSDGTLVGVVNATLCQKHRREFSLVAWTWPEWDQGSVLRTRRHAAVQAGNEDRSAVLAEELNGVEAALRELALKWLAEHKEVADDKAETGTPQPG